MATITNRTDFTNYCLRRLGFPVIEINVDDDQVQDRIDDALQYWQDYHFDGLQKVYYIKALTGSQLTTNTSISSVLANTVTLVGATSDATATIVSGDTTGTLAAANAILTGNSGTLRTYYNDSKNVKTILNSNIGTIDYNQGIVKLNSFGPIQVNNDLGQLTLTATPTTTILSSSYNRIVTVDPFDQNAISVTVTAKS